MKSALANTWESVYPSQTTACLLDQFLKIKPERVYWKILAKLQVKFQLRSEEISCKLQIKSLRTSDVTVASVSSCRGSPGGDLVPPAG